MKLWQKVSLTALVFVMLAIQLTQFLVLERSFENSIQRERQTAVSAHEALSASLSNHAAYERLKAGKLLLSTDEIAELLSSTVTADISTASEYAYHVGQRERPERHNHRHQDQHIVCNSFRLHRHVQQRINHHFGYEKPCKQEKQRTEQT